MKGSLGMEGDRGSFIYFHGQSSFPRAYFSSAIVCKSHQISFASFSKRSLCLKPGAGVFAAVRTRCTLFGKDTREHCVHSLTTYIPNWEALQRAQASRQARYSDALLAFFGYNDLWRGIAALVSNAVRRNCHDQFSEKHSYKVPTISDVLSLHGPITPLDSCTNLVPRSVNSASVSVSIVDSCWLIDGSTSEHGRGIRHDQS